MTLFQFPIALRFPQDAIDILLVAYLVYRILLLIKGTRAFQILVGLILLIGAYSASRWFELVTLNWILKEFLSSFIILVVVLFQSDIRRALAQMGKQRFWGMGAQNSTTLDAMDEIVRAATILAAEGNGAIIVIERSTKLADHVEGGVLLDARLSCELILSVFQPGSPVHDGALTIDDGKIACAGCFLPLSARTDIDKDLGTRHRAAMGITEETDSVALVVSEERGAISLVVGGRITRDLSGADLREALADLLEVGGKLNKSRASLKAKVGEANP